jgi:hypothetical protein
MDRPTVAWMIGLLMGVFPCAGFAMSISSNVRNIRLLECSSRFAPRTSTNHQPALHAAQLNTNTEYDDYWDEEYFDIDDESRPYKVSVNSEPQPLDWEECDDGCWVLLPPSYVTTPTAIVHFCGGTFFGSSPKLWYGPLLEGLVRATSCIVIATAIPITLAENPLQHVLLSRKLQRQFQSAYVNVVEDEYGDVSNIPVVALGHSLGSRLLAVLATLAPPKNAAAPPYKSYILMSFTNYGASASIPGVRQLIKSRNRLDTPESRPKRQRRRNQNDDDDEDDDGLFDDELDEIMDELQESLWERTTKVRDALTPRSEDLEFYPSPDQLWDALAKENRYTVPDTLIVQFDDDEVDQSAKLAAIITNSSSVRYARLRGNHLSPVAVEAKDGSWLDLPSKATKAILKIMRGKSTREKSTDTAAMRDLRQTIARYITDVATK